MVLIAQIIAWIWIADVVLTSIFTLNPVGRDYIKRHNDIEKEMDRYPYKAVIIVIVLLTLIFA